MKKIVSVILALFTVFNVSSYCNNFICNASEVCTTSESNRQKIVLDLSNDSDINFIVKDKTQENNSKLGSAIKKVINSAALILSGIITGKILCKKYPEFDKLLENTFNKISEQYSNLKTKLIESIITKYPEFDKLLKNTFSKISDQHGNLKTKINDKIELLRIKYPSFVIL